MVYDFSKTNLHFLGIYLELIDQPVDLVNEKYRSDMFPECLSQNGFGLGHCTFDSIHDNNSAVYSPHCTGDVPTKVNVSGSINKVDKVVFIIKSVNHGNVGGVDCDASFLFLFIGVHE